MYKLIIASVLVAAVTAVPTFLHGGDHHIAAVGVVATPTVVGTGLHTVIRPETIQVHEPTIAKVGNYVQRVPTAISHQRQTIVTKHSDVRTPIVAPAVRTYTSQVLRAHSVPVLYAAAAPVVTGIHHRDIIGHRDVIGHHDLLGHQDLLD